MSTAVIMSTAVVDIQSFRARNVNRATGVATGAATGARLRITKRGRAVLIVLVSVPLVVVSLVFALNGGVAAATSSSASSSLSYVTISAGQTLWQLAGEIAPSADPREVISDVVHLNQLAGTDVQAGQRLAIPARYAH